MSERFADLWRKLDASRLRLVWPIAVGAVIAGLSLLVVRSIFLAGGISLVVVLAIGWFGRSVARRLEEMDRLSG